MSTIRVTQRKSRNGCDKSQRDTLRSLRLHRIGAGTDEIMNEVIAKRMGLIGD